MTSPEVMSFFVYVKTIQQPPHRAGDILSPGWKRNRKKVSFIPFTVWKTGDNGIIGNKDGKNVIGGNEAFRPVEYGGASQKSGIC